MAHLARFRLWHRPCLFHDSMKLSVALLIGVVAFGTPSVVESQERGGGEQPRPDIRARVRPPAGMCASWLDEVAASRHAARTDCASAVRTRPEKGRVIFGDDYVSSKRPDTTTRTKTPPAAKGFAPGSSSKKPPIRLRRP